MKKQAILIMTDTQRWDMVGCYGNSSINTPCLDAFAERSMRFENAYTCQPVCGPARSALFTGLYPHSNGSWTNSMALSANVHTVGQRLTPNDVHCAYIGKWHLDGGDYFGLGVCPDGYDPEYWYDMKCYLDELTPEERYFSRQPQSSDIPGGITREFTYASRVTKRAIDFIEKHQDEDYFLVVSYDEPHGPFLCPPPYNTMFDGYEFPRYESLDDTLEDKPSSQKAWAGPALTEPAPETISGDEVRRYLGCNAFVDSEIGRVLDAAKKDAGDALVIYTSDHGDAMSAHRLCGKGPCLYDEVTHIPMFIRWPGVTEDGAVFKAPVSHIDITPTLMDYFGLEKGQWMDGTTLQPVLKGEQEAHPAFMEFSRYEIDHDGFGGFQPLRGVFDGRYKMTINLMCEDELYDMQEDPHEMKNLILDPAYHDIRNKLHDEILNWMNETRDPFRGYWWERRFWREDARPATWDYTGMTRQRENEEFESRQLDYTTGLEMEQAVRAKDANTVLTKKKE